MVKMLKSGWLLIAVMLLALAGAAPTGPATAEPAHQSILRVPAGIAGPVSRSVTLGLSKSMVIELPRNVRDVVVSDPKKLEAVVNTSRRAFLIGVEVGQANAFFFDNEGNQILTLEVRIERDLSAATRMIHKLMPGAQVKLEAINDNIVLTGSVANPSDAARAADLVSRLVDDKEKVLNMLAVQAKEQVLLKVTVVEMERNIIKQLGVNLQSLLPEGNFTFTTLTNFAFPFSAQQTASSVASKTAAWQANGRSVTATLRALERDGLIRTLAEPTLTAISGETANFLAGGEFPIPIAQDDSKISIEFKPFGVGLAFTPLVMSEGLISLKVSTEVSELTNEGAITLSLITIPGLKVRRANTTVELPSGGSLVIAGLISDETKQSMEGYPGLKNLPILGGLFRSRDFIKSETELVVIVTPYTVKPKGRKELARSDQGFAWAGDWHSNLLGHLNKRYGKRPESMPVGRYEGDYGFIVK